MRRTSEATIHTKRENEKKDPKLRHFESSPQRLGERACTYLNTVLKAVELPAGVSDLNTGLSDVDRDNFTHFLKVCYGLLKECEYETLKEFE